MTYPLAQLTASEVLDTIDRFAAEEKDKKQYDQCCTIRVMRPGNELGVSARTCNFGGVRVRVEKPAWLQGRQAFPEPLPVGFPWAAEREAQEKGQ